MLATPWDRERLTKLLVGLLDGTVSYSNFATAELCASDDPAVAQIWSELEEEFQNDLYPDRPVALASEAQDMVRRTILFLRVGCRYEWSQSPAPSKVVSVAIAICFVTSILCAFATAFATTAILAVILAGCSVVAYRAHLSRYHQKLNCWRGQGDFDVWPFRHREEYERARSCATPVLPP